MKALLVSGALASALLLAGCGGDAGAGNSGSDSATGGASGQTAAIPAPNGGDWTTIVSATPEGGFVMGNPNAPVKLVEFASMTCGHCATFAEEGIPALRDNYVKSGRVSLEVRNFVRDPADMAAALLARCGGATPFFPMSDQIFAAQEEWLGKLQTLTPAEQQRLSTLAPNQVPLAMATAAGLDQFARVRGLPAEKAQQCLTNQAEIERLAGIAGEAMKQFPNFPGTPTFLINGTMVENAASWAALEPKLKEAL